MSDLNHECGIAAVYYLPSSKPSDLSRWPQNETSRLIPRMLQDIQNRGQLSAGMTSYLAYRDQLIQTHREIGVVAEVFRLSHPGKSESLMRKFAGSAAIGHVRYATCGKDDENYAQPFERSHVQKHKWFAFGFNGQLANYQELKANLLADDQYHLTRDCDTEVVMHLMSRALATAGPGHLLEMWRATAAQFDGSYCMVYLDANGDMLVARDPLGLRPLCFAVREPLFAAASESVALLNLGFARDEIQTLEPGYAVTVIDGQLNVDPFAKRRGRAIVFSSGSILPTSPARSMESASTKRARGWESNWRGWRKPTGSWFTMATRLSFPSRIPAKQPLIRWRLNLASLRAKA